MIYMFTAARYLTPILFLVLLVSFVLLRKDIKSKNIKYIIVSILALGLIFSGVQFYYLNYSPNYRYIGTAYGSDTEIQYFDAGSVVYLNLKVETSHSYESSEAIVRYDIEIIDPGGNVIENHSSEKSIKVDNWGYGQAYDEFYFSTTESGNYTIRAHVNVSSGSAFIEYHYFQQSVWLDALLDTCFATIVVLSAALSVYLVATYLRSGKRDGENDGAPLNEKQEMGDEKDRKGVEETRTQFGSWQFRNRRKWLMNSLILMIVLSLVGMIFWGFYYTIIGVFPMAFLFIIVYCLVHSAIERNLSPLLSLVVLYIWYSFYSIPGSIDWYWMFCNMPLRWYEYVEYGGLQYTSMFALGTVTTLAILIVQFKKK